MAKLFSLVCDGNSITAGLNATPNSDTGGWPGVFRATQNVADRLWQVKSIAVSGATTAQRTAAIPTALAPLLHRNYGANIVTFFEGVNDVITGGANLATAQANWTAYVAAARATGFKVLCCTPTPTTNTGNSANTIMPQLATWLRANPQLSDFPIVDLAADPSLDDPTDTNFYQGDGLHPNNAGYAVIAGLVLARIAALA